MRAVNLLPKEANQRGKSLRAEDPAVVVGSVLGLVVLLALGLGFMNVHSHVSAEQKKLTAARLELALLAREKRAAPKSYKPVKQQPIVPIPAVTSEEQPRLDAVTAALATRIAWDRILREFSLVLPGDVSLKSLALTTPVLAGAAATTGAPAGAVGSQNLTMDGTTFSHDAVARLLSRLMLIPDLTNVTLASSTASDSGEVEFNITAGVKGAPVAPAPVTPAAVTPTTTTAGATS